MLEAHELEEGKNYFIVLTTSAGLYRYDIHDLVRCVGFRGTAPVLEFLNKGSSFSSITGEKLSEFQAASAVTAAFGELGLPIETFTLAPVVRRPARLRAVDRARALRAAIPTPWPAPSTTTSASWNCEYANRRRPAGLGPLRIREIPPGTWDAFRQRRISRVGGSLEQYKHPCLANDLGFIERLLANPDSP